MLMLGATKNSSSKERIIFVFKILRYFFRLEYESFLHKINRGCQYQVAAGNDIENN